MYQTALSVRWKVSYEDLVWFPHRAQSHAKKASLQPYDRMQYGKKQTLNEILINDN